MTKPMPKVWRECVFCRKAFKTLKGRYCSAKCRVYAARGK